MLEIIQSLGYPVFKDMFANSPQLVAFLEANFAGPENQAARSRLLEYADESDYSLRHWVESLHTIQSWLDAHGLHMSIDDQIGYVSCAGQAAGAGSNLTVLPAMVEEMLDAYGCERAVERGSTLEQE